MGGIRIEVEHRFGASLRAGYDYIVDMANWPEYWPDLLRVAPGSRWSAPGDRATLVMRLLGRPVELAMTLVRIEPYRLVEYTSVQRGLPPARHERHFAEAGDGFVYRTVVELAPRAGPPGALDRLVVRRAVARALRQTMANLEPRLGVRGSTAPPYSYSS